MVKMEKDLMQRYIDTNILVDFLYKKLPKEKIFEMKMPMGAVVEPQENAIFVYTR